MSPVQRMMAPVTTNPVIAAATARPLQGLRERARKETSA